MNQDKPTGVHIETRLRRAEVVATLPRVAFSEIFNAYSDAVVVADGERCIYYLNPAAESLFGYAIEEIQGCRTEILYANPADYIAQGQKRFNRDKDQGQEGYRIRYRRADGDVFLALTTAAPMCDSRGEVRGFVAVIRPARSSDQSLDTLQKVSEITANVDWSHDQKIQALLEVGLEHFGLDIAIQSHIVGNEYTVEYCVDRGGELEPNAQFELSETYCEHTLNQAGAVAFHYAGNSHICNHPCYEKFALEAYIGAPVRIGAELYGTLNFSSAQPIQPVGKDDLILVDLLAHTMGALLYQKASEAEFVALARTDFLTGLPNRRAVLDRLNEHLELCKRDGSQLALVSVDIDRFKRINDEWGHSAGDTALVAFADVAMSLGRKTDFCGRMGGEEFVFVLPRADLEAGKEFAEKLRVAVRENWFEVASDHRIHYTISCGVAEYQNWESVAQLLARADAAMYKAKQQGRDQVCE